MNYSFDEKKPTPLCKIMGKYGSDKGNIDIINCWHNYTTFYYSIFNKIKNNKLRIFELGLGTNNINIPSNMGIEGKPCASIYGWKEFFSNSLIFGADIDKDILINEDRIKTYYCDQQNPKIINEMWSKPELEDDFDIIIEDGLHDFNANVCFFENSIHKLKSGGFYIIENIKEEHLFINKINNYWNIKYPDCIFNLLKIPSIINNIDNNLLVIYKKYNSISINFLTYGSHSNYIDAANRLCRQANNLNIFKNIYNYNYDDLKNDKDFWHRHGIFIENNKRGCGYWLWKSYIIHKTIEKMQDGELLLYLDSGCEIIIEEKEYMIENINNVKKYKLLASLANNTSEYKYCKMDLIHKLDMNNNIEELEMFQIEAGVIFLEVSQQFKNIIKEWYELCCNYHNIDDSPSIIPNNSNYIEHRHDQSIFSLLIKKNKLYQKCVLSSKIFCIKYDRNRTGISHYSCIS
jgi:hypothetical protein